MPPTPTPSRRRTTARAARLAAVAVLLPALLLTAAACGPPGTTDTRNDPGTATASGSSTGFPVTVRHRYGSTVIPHRPRRVIALGWNEADTVLALGVTPVAIEDWQQLGLHDGQVNPWARGAAHGRGPVVLPRGDLDFKQIAALHPDLILDVNGRANSSRQNYRTLSRIAPTVASPTSVTHDTLPWQDQVRIDARALGLPKKGEELIRSTTTRIRAAARAHPEFKGRTATVNWAVEGGWKSYVHGDVRTQQLESLGFTLPKAVTRLPASSYAVPLPMEKTHTIEADAVLLVAYARSARSVKAETAVQALPAYRQGRTVVLDNQAEPVLRAAFATGSPLSINYTLRRLVPKLAAALAHKAS